MKLLQVTENTQFMRLRITFAKTDAMRFTSHLDLHRTWERTLRRARLPLLYSKGYNPHPRINLASALPLGFTGENEVIDIWLEEKQPLPKIKTDIISKTPPGIQVHQVQEIGLRAPALQKQLAASEYIITFPEPIPDLHMHCQEMLNAEQIMRERRGKTYDLRPLILELRILSNDNTAQQRLLAILTAQEGATGRPDEVINALGASPLAARVHRNKLVFQSNSP
jgi:radical SAM-linked protein